MKESTGELSMVVITIVAVIALLAIWQAVKGPLTNWVGTRFGEMTHDGDNTKKETKDDFDAAYDAAGGRR